MMISSSRAASHAANDRLERASECVSGERKQPAVRRMQAVLDRVVQADPDTDCGKG
jgi:hypothetical protein